MAISISDIKFRAWYNDGTPLDYGKVYTYYSGTNTPKTTYTSEGQEVENSNPVILNSAGYADICLDGSYKIVVKDKNDVEIYTTDPISSPSQVISEWTGQSTPTHLSSISFSVVDDRTLVFTPQRLIKVHQDSGDVFGQIVNSSFDGTVTIVVVDVFDGDSLTVSMEAVWVNIITPNSSDRFSNKFFNGMSDLCDYGPGRFDGQQATIAYFHNLADTSGGGLFIWDSGVNKSEHDGGWVIDPDKSFPSNWTDQSMVDDWLTSTPAGNGCWIRQVEDVVNAKHWGVFATGSTIYATTDTKLLNKAVERVDGKIFFLPYGEYLINGTIDLNKRQVRIKGEGKTYSVNRGTKIAYLPTSGIALDMSGCAHSSIVDVGFDGDSEQTHDVNEVTSVGILVNDATYIQFERVEMLRFQTCILQDASIVDTDNIYSVTLDKCEFSGCDYAIDMQYACHNFNMVSGVITNCDYGVRFYNSASVNFWGTDIQIQGEKSGVLPPWETPTSRLFYFENCLSVNFNGVYSETNGEAISTQMMGEINRVQGFSLTNFYIQNSSTAFSDPPPFLIKAHDSIGISITNTSSYHFPENLTMVEATGTTNPHLIVSGNNVLHPGCKINNNSAPPQLTLNNVVETSATYGTYNAGRTSFDGKNLTYKGLLQVSNWGALTAGAYVGIKLPAPVNVAAVAGLQIFAIGRGSNGEETALRFWIKASQPEHIRVYFDASGISLLTDDALSEIYFQISYEPDLPVLSGN